MSGDTRSDIQQPLYVGNAHEGQGNQNNGQTIEHDNIQNGPGLTNTLRLNLESKSILVIFALSVFGILVIFGAVFGTVYASQHTSESL